MTSNERAHVLETTTGSGTLHVIQRMLNRLWSAHNVPDMDRMWMDLAAGEICANIIEHSGGVHLRMEVRLLPELIEIRFTDDGGPARIELSNLHLPGDLAERGRGLAMALSVLDELSYRRDDEGNHWMLVRRRSESCDPGVGP